VASRLRARGPGSLGERNEIQDGVACELRIQPELVFRSAGIPTFSSHGRRAVSFRASNVQQPPNEVADTWERLLMLTLVRCKREAAIVMH
jgi:hypothetical protein